MTRTQTLELLLDLFEGDASWNQGRTRADGYRAFKNQPLYILNAVLDLRTAPEGDARQAAQERYRQAYDRQHSTWRRTSRG